MQHLKQLSIPFLCVILGIFAYPIASFTTPSSSSSYKRTKTTVLQGQSNDNEVEFSRRSFFHQSTTFAAASVSFLTPTTAYAAEKESEESTPTTLQTPLYSIARVREAVEQETRLIKSGKFKDVQRANVKLAVKFIVDNYRLNDNFIAASAYLEGDRKIKAVEIGQSTVQNLITILEYFDSSDVENIKVGASGLAGKEKIVLDGLAAARKSIDEFLSLFPKDDVNAVIAKIEAENELNRQEFDPNLGSILNPKPQPTAPTAVIQ